MTTTSQRQASAQFSTGGAGAVVFLKCRKCGAQLRARPPQVGELGSRVDRQIRCRGTNEHNAPCGTLMGMWSSSTGG